ncbi:MAG: hypothetical protein LQ337_000572 [Flavoplaca oasis]|nr:MAG: hypothetical protein LQ337_000572 [Flavoplaca oasis]
MRNDDLANRIGVNEPHVEHKGDEVMVEDNRLEIKVDGNEGPRGEIGNQAVERFDGVFGYLTPMLHYIDESTIPLERIENEDKATIHHVPFIEGQIVNVIGDEIVVCYTQCVEHRLLPKAAATFYTSNGINDAKGQNALDRSGDDA